MGEQVSRHRGPCIADFTAKRRTIGGPAAPLPLIGHFPVGQPRMDDERWLSSLAAAQQPQGNAYNAHATSAHHTAALETLLRSASNAAAAGSAGHAQGHAQHSGSNALFQSAMQPGSASYLDGLAAGAAGTQSHMHGFDAPTAGTNEPQSPTQVLLNLLGLLPGGQTGGTPHHPDANGGYPPAQQQQPPLFNQMLDAFADGGNGTTNGGYTGAQHATLAHALANNGPGLGMSGGAGMNFSAGGMQPDGGATTLNDRAHLSAAAAARQFASTRPALASLAHCLHPLCASCHPTNACVSVCSESHA